MRNEEYGFQLLSTRQKSASQSVSQSPFRVSVRGGLAKRPPEVHGHDVLWQESRTTPNPIELSNATRLVSDILDE